MYTQLYGPCKLWKYTHCALICIISARCCLVAKALTSFVRVLVLALYRITWRTFPGLYTRTRHQPKNHNTMPPTPTPTHTHAKLTALYA